jgi:hypothetical protein
MLLAIICCYVLEAQCQVPPMPEAGASEAHFLRARALLNESKPAEAEAEMEAYLGGRKLKDLPQGQRLEWLEVLMRAQIESKGTPASIIDVPVSELVQQIPDLKGLRTAATEDQEIQILRTVGERVRAFFEHFPNTSSVEEITLERLHASGKVVRSFHQKFKYLLLCSRDRHGLGIEEYRTDFRGNQASLGGLGERLMITQGFAAHALHFHPLFQSGSRFRYLGRQALNGIDAHVLAFAQRPETAMIIEGFTTDRASTALLVHGIVWIDPSNYQILRMVTELLTPAPEVRLQRQTTDVRFGEVRFTSVGSKLWLPRDVAVTVSWNGKTFRNRHRYSDFQLFNVEAREAVPQTPDAR